MKTIMITGATGFLGHSVLRALLPEYRIIALKRCHSNIKRIAEIQDQIIIYDLDTISLQTIFEKHTVDAVIHAATTYDGEDDDRTAQILDSNLVLPISIAKCMINKRHGAFLNVDSFYSKHSTHYKYQNTYRFTKKKLHEILNAISNSVKVFHFRLEHVYGCGDNDGKFVPWLTKNILSGKQEIYLTGGEQKRDFIYLEDAANAFKTVLDNLDSLITQSNCNFTFDVGTGISTSVREFAELIKLRSGSKSHLVFGALKYRDHELMESRADISQLKNLGWNPVVNVNEGINRIIDYYNNPDIDLNSRYCVKQENLL